MAQLVVQAAAATVGFMIGGPTGAQIGWAVGGVIGSAFAPTQKSEGPRIGDLAVTTSSYGTTIPYVQGHPRIAGQIVWASTKREIATTEEQGKGGGGAEYTSYTYEVDLLILLTDNPITSVSRIWKNGELDWTGLANDLDSIVASQTTSNWHRLTVYTGGPAQLPDPTYEAAVGTANAPAYRGRGCIFIQGLQLGNSGQIPNLTFEVAVDASESIYNGDLLIRRNAANTDWINAVNSVPVLNVYGQVNNSTGPQLTIDADAGNTLGGLVTARMNDMAATSRNIFVQSVGGAHWQPSQVIPYTGNVTLEVFVFMRSSDAMRGGWVFNDGGMGYTFASPNDHTNIATQGTFSAYLDTEGQLWFYTGLGQTTTDLLKLTLRASKLVPRDEWCHLAFVRQGIVWSVYINGDPVASGAERRVPAMRSNFFIGSMWSQSLPYPVTGSFVGNMAEFRLTIGRVLYPSTFTVPAVPLGYDQITLQEPTLQSVVNGMLLRTGLSASQFDTTALSAITRPVRSMAISSVSSARTVLDMLAQSYHFEAVLSDKIYFRPRATAPAATLTFNELGVVVDSGSTPDPLPLTQANELEIPAQMALTYSNVDGDYQTDTQYSDRLLTGQESTSAMTLPLGFTSSEAKQIVDAMLLDKAVSALTTSVSLSLTRAALEPTDVVLLTGEDGSTYRMRIVKKAEASGVTTFDCVQDDSTVFTQTGTTSGGTASQTTVLPTPTTTLELLDVPLLRDVDNLPGHYAAVKGSAANWTSCGLYDSLDDLTYTPNTTISSQAVIGTCTTTLPTWAGGNVFDESSSVTVNVGNQQLSSVTRDDILASQSTNAALIGSEVLQYRTATLVSAGVYTLSGFLRGQRATPTSHSAAERFVLLASGGLRFIPLQQGDLGRVRYYKAASAGQKLSAVTSQSLTPAGITLKPFAPVNARANRNAADTVLAWTRQTRLSTRIVGTLGISSPLGEALESYEVEIYTAGHALLKRTLTSSTPTVTYTSAQQVTDFGSAPASLAIKVYQISATVGRGSPLTTTV